MFAIVTVITALVLVFAGMRGAAPERWAATIVGIRYGVDALYHWLVVAPSFAIVDPGHAVLDGLMVAGFTWLALRANRVWPVWMAGSALIAVFGHIMVFAGAVQLQRAYWAMTNVPHFVQLFTLLTGTIFHCWRLRVVGPYRDWSPRYQ